MANIQIGSVTFTESKNIYRGTSATSAVYRGSSKIWQHWFAPSYISNFSASTATYTTYIKCTWTNATGNPTPTYNLLNASTGAVLASGVTSGYNLSWILGPVSLRVVAVNGAGSRNSNANTGSIKVTAGSKEYASVTSTTWHVPNGVTSVRCRMIGGGEGGMVNSRDNYSGGGYSGAIKDQSVAVTPNTNVTVVVGAGGANNGGNGGTSRFHTITAAGGSGSTTGAGTSTRYNGGNQARSTGMGTFYNGHSDFQWYGGQAGFGNGGDGQRTRPAPRSPNGTRGGGGGSASPNHYTAGKGGVGVVRLDWS